MPIFSKTKTRRCPNCDHRNPVDAHRCDVCTKVLDNDDSPAQAVFDETLWSEPVTKRRVRQNRGGFTLGLLCLGAFGGLFLANVAATGSFIPHPIQERFADKGADWKTFAGNPAFRVILPGDPIGTSVSGPSGVFSSSSVWVDSRWHEVFDADTISPAAIRDARIELHAALVVASGPAGVDARLTAPETLAALRPGAVLADPVTSGVRQVDGGSEFDVTASYTGWPDAAAAGTVAARFLEVDGTIYVIATFVEGGEDQDLHARLTEGFELV